jgi:hypothetical protein
MDYKQHKGSLRGKIKDKAERKLYNKQRRNTKIEMETDGVCRFCGGSPIENVDGQNHCPYCDKYW